MRETDVRRLKVRYSDPVPKLPNDRLLADQPGLKISSAIDLGDVFLGDLDKSKYGIGWWEFYKNIDRKRRIFISDYLAACGRDVVTNLIEAYDSRMEFDHALGDLQEYMKRGITKRKQVIPPPRGPYDALSYFRVSDHLTGILRGLASALDCFSGCIVGVAGLPTDIVRTSFSSASRCLQREAARSPRLAQLYSDLNKCDSDAGPAGWASWLIAMRNTVVHRARRVVTSAVVHGDHGSTELVMLLPRSPELTEVEAWIHAGGYTGAFFEAPAEEFLSRLIGSVQNYIDSSAKLLMDLWEERKQNPSLIVQSSEQWKDPQKIINPAPAFGGYDIPPVDGQTVGVGASDEMSDRIYAAALTGQGNHDIVPVPDVWA